MSVSIFAKHLVLAGFVLLLAVAGSTAARADSITYDVTATYSNGMSLVGQYVWDTSLLGGSGGATSYLLDLTSTTGPATCADASGGLCTSSFATFTGTGAINGSFVIILSLLDAANPVFTLGIEDNPAGQLVFSETLTPTPSVRVPEPSAISCLVATFILLGCAMFTRARSPRAVQN